MTDPTPGAPGALHIVSTPIGNLGDITPRAVAVLGRVGVVLCEDTRHSRPLLAHVGVSTPTVAYHEHNEASTTPRILARLLAGEDVALITDAGTPLLSDPGARLVRAAADAGVRVVPVPGASALLAALVAAGLPAERFVFLGFPPRKGGEREALLGEVAASAYTAVLYEAPGRTAATLAQLAERAGADRPAAVARELTKQFEEVRRGTLGELAEYYRVAPPRGEVVLVVGGRPPAAGGDEGALRTAAEALAAAGLSARDVARRLVDEHGASRNVAYRVAQEAGAGRRASSVGHTTDTDETDEDH